MDGDSVAPLVVIQRALPLLRAPGRLHPCVLCRRIEPIFSGEIGRMFCQRCGAEFHDSCYWRLAAGAAERAAYRMRGDLDLFLCRACRS